MKTPFNKAPLPMVGYLMTLLGFVFLGTSVAALALGSSLAPWLTAAMVASYGLAVLCFTLRKRQIAAADPNSDIALGFDPIRGDTDRRAAKRYRQRYRPQPAEAAEQAPGRRASYSGTRPTKAA